MALASQREESSRSILRAIASRGPVARADLAVETGLSRPTVTEITANLLKGGLIKEVPRAAKAESQGRGRPRVDLTIEGAARMVAGLKVSGTEISLVLTDFDGRPITHLDQPLTPGPLPAQQLAEDIARGLTALADQAGVPLSNISGVGVGLAGIMDAKAGHVYWSPSLDQRDVAFQSILAETISLPVFIDNDANLVAIAEKSVGLGRGLSDFIVVTIESGVGMGIVLGGEVYRGARGSGAEFGHTKVQFEGALCRCGQRGCLEAYVADYAIQREAASVGAVSHTIQSGDAATKLFHAAAAGDSRARSVLDKAGRMFAIGLANIVNVFDPELIILSGEQMQSDHLYATNVIEEMRRNTVQIGKPPPRVEVHNWDNMMWARGAAAYALEFVQDIAVRDLVRA